MGNLNWDNTPVYTGNLWDHAKWLLYRGGLLIIIEVGSVRIVLSYWLGDLPNKMAASTGSTVVL